MRVDEVFVSGGGTHNPTLMRMLTKAMNPIPVMESSEVGLDVDAKEAIAFAVMAYEQPINGRRMCRWQLVHGVPWCWAS